MRVVFYTVETFWQNRKSNFWRQILDLWIWPGKDRVKRRLVNHVAKNCAKVI